MTMILLASLIAAGATDLQARVAAPGTLQDLIQASDVIIVGEVERGLFWGLAMGCALLVLLTRRRARLLLLPAIVCCASCRGGTGAGEHYSIDVKRILRGTCSEPAVQLSVPAAGPCYEPDLQTRTEYVMFLRKADGHYTTSWTAHAILPVENGRVKATWRSDSGKEFTVEEFAKMVSKE